MTGRLRVLRIIARMNVGGPALQVVGLQEGLDRRRFEVRLLAGSVGPGEADYVDIRAPGTNVVRVDGLGRAPKPWDDSRAFAALLRELRRFRPHIVHTHTAKAGVLGRLAARTTRTPATVHTFHGHLLRGYFSPTMTRALVSTERALARSTSRLVSVGRRVRDDLLAAGVGRPEQYVVVAPGVRLPAIPDRDSARRILSLPSGAPVVAFVGRLTQVKRPDRLGDLFTLVGERRPDSVFVVVGEGELLGELRARTTMLGDRVRFLGWRTDVETVLAAADLIVLTSDNEGMPVSLIEAAMAGRPAVTPDVGSAGEVVLDGRTGLLCSTSAADLARAVERLLDDEDLRQRMGCDAREHAQASFGVRRLVEDHERLYEELAKEKGFR